MPYTYDYPHPAVTTDIVTIATGDEALRVLLIRRGAPPYKGAWALPGGFVDPGENLEEAARRELEEETGVSGVYLEQLHAFGDPDRDPRERVITVAYIALIPSDTIEIQASTDADAAGWFAVNDLPELAFDHRRILDVARRHLADKLDYSTVAFKLLPQEFTLSELMHVHELIRGERLDKQKFRKHILRRRLLTQTGREGSSGEGRPARLYRLADPGTCCAGSD